MCDSNSLYKFKHVLATQLLFSMDDTEELSRYKPDMYKEVGVSFKHLAYLLRVLSMQALSKMTEEITTVRDAIEHGDLIAQEVAIYQTRRSTYYFVLDQISQLNTIIHHILDSVDYHTNLDYAKWRAQKDDHSVHAMQPVYPSDSESSSSDEDMEQDAGNQDSSNQHARKKCYLYIDDTESEDSDERSGYKRGINKAEHSGNRLYLDDTEFDDPGDRGGDKRDRNDAIPDEPDIVPPAKKQPKRSLFRPNSWFRPPTNAYIMDAGICLR
jgi:hypothetical protein